MRSIYPIDKKTGEESTVSGRPSKVRIAIAGANGRMGRSVFQCAEIDDAVEVVAVLTRPDSPRLGTHYGGVLTLTDRLNVPCDALIDFTVGDGTSTWLEVCRAIHVPMVIGATGQSESTLREIRAASSEIAIVKATNFSIGIQVLMHLVGEVARRLGPGFDVEIVETHHRRKLDAPSGTALSLIESIRKALGDGGKIVHGRHGQTGPRPRDEIGVHSLRMGAKVGEHEVHFSSDGETLSLRHAAHSREAFAGGALCAAKWVVGRSPGFYGMNDVVSG